MNNLIYQEDCLLTLKNEDIIYDYIFTSPPDLNELGYDINQIDLYKEFLYDRLYHMNPKKNVITFSLTDRKANSKILSKSFIIKDIMFSLGYDLVSHKIWCKSLKQNLYRLNYSNVLTFGKGKIKNYKCRGFCPDVWIIKHSKYKNYGYGMPEEIPIRCISQYTEINDVVYDPFFGSGTTACACIKTNRNWIGTEIDSDVCDLAKNRLQMKGLLNGTLL
ncbi:MAG: DNA-methyltransferase [bacterium]